LAGDVAFLPTASYCGRIRGDFLNLTALLCGNRFGRSFVVPGGNALAVEEGRAAELAQRLAVAGADVTSAVELLWKMSSVLARFEGTGTLTRELARALGLVGVAARATGLRRDVRADFPLDHDALASIPVATAESGDVMGRALVRWREIRTSLAFLREQLAALPEGAHWVTSETLRPNRLAVSLVEGWRGEICHVAVTDEDGRFAHYKVVDPSFHNWAGLALALRDQQISDFPLCNKSFNLSYCGQDL
jgi:Ni,Fe-hydrogenase III large subunit